MVAEVIINRTAKKLSDKLGVIWIDEILTGLQDVAGMGVKRDEKKQDNKYKLIYPDGTQIEQYFTEIEALQFTETFKRQNICMTIID